jgi:ABC-type branched-subunit amino acid transport system ATPase component/ABC-type branched-subunit amino acid transport system permease subunit
VSGIIARRANIAVAAALMIALPPLTAHAMPRLLTGTAALDLSLAVGWALAALSLNVLLGYTGQISLGHGALLGVGAFASGIMTSRLHLSMLVGLPVAVVVSALVALVIGVPALRLRGLYLAMATIAFAVAMQYSVLRSSTLSGGSAGIGLPRRLWGSTFLTGNADFLIVGLLLVLMAWVIDTNIVATRLGRAFRTIRENEAVAQSFGIDVVRYKLFAFVVSGGLAGLAGAIYGHALGFVNNETFSLEKVSLPLVAIVIVGGLGRRAAVVVAAVTFTLIPDLIPSLHGYEFVIGALILMLTVSRHPDGIADLLTPSTLRAPAADDADEDHALPHLPAPAIALATPATTVPLLEVADVTVRFGGLVAVDGASFSVPRGTIVGLIGPNGAGKSTLFNAISGLVRTEHGVIRYAGEEIQHLRPDQRARRGIARSFQQVGLAKDLSVLDNFLLAQHQASPYGDISALLFSRRARRGEDVLRDRAREAIAALGFERYAEMPVRNLSGGQQRIVEIGCLLVTAPDLVMLDEPSAGMAPAAAESLAERLRDLRDRLDRTVLLIEHNVPLVLDTCDSVCVLDAGRIIAAGLPAEITASADVIDAYFGQAVPA